MRCPVVAVSLPCVCTLLFYSLPSQGFISVNKTLTTANKPPGRPYLLRRSRRGGGLWSGSGAGCRTLSETMRDHSRWCRVDAILPHHSKNLATWICARGGGTGSQLDHRRTSDDDTNSFRRGVPRSFSPENIADTSSATATDTGAADMASRGSLQDRCWDDIQTPPDYSQLSQSIIAYDNKPANEDVMDVSSSTTAASGTSDNSSSSSNNDNYNGRTDGSTTPRKESAHLKLRKIHHGRGASANARARAGAGGGDVGDRGGGGDDDDDLKIDKVARYQPVDGVVDGGIAATVEEQAVSSAAAVEDGGNDGGALASSIPSGTVCLLEYTAPGPDGGGEGGKRYASLGSDGSKFAMFLDAAVRAGEISSPPTTGTPNTTSMSSPASATIVPDSGTNKNDGTDSVDIVGSEDEKKKTNAKLTAPLQRQTNMLQKWKTNNGTDNEIAVPDATAIEGVVGERQTEQRIDDGEGEVLEAAASVKAWLAATTAAVAGEAGRWASQVVVSAVDVADTEVKDTLQGLWTEGRLLSQDRDAADVLSGREKSFSDLLESYTTRTKSNHWEEIPQARLLAVLERHHPEVLSRCGYDPNRSIEDTFASLRGLLEWFRQEFPYYYDGCLSCGNREDNTFVGYVSPTDDERDFRAGRTELYHCSACGGISRFARYAAVSKVLETQRGRCGEYSVLMLRFLEVLGYTCRWVVDWSDHVWAEARIGGRWVHVDPCEAAIDEPLMYESWGKNQTYIIAFAPREVVDVTAKYTSDFEAAKARRDVDQDEMQTLIANATRTLQDL